MTSNTFSPTLDPTYYCVQETDATGNVVYTATDMVTVNPQPTITISPATNTIDAGQSVLFTNSTSGGTTPYLWSYSVNSMSGVTITGNSIKFANTGTYNVIEYVQDATNANVVSNNAVITVDTAFVPSAAPTPTSPTIDTGQTITLTILPPTTGTGPYTYLWYSGTSSTCSSDTCQQETH